MKLILLGEKGTDVESENVGGFKTLSSNLLDYFILIV